MGHLIEEYAKSLGVKIGKPVLMDHYYPLLSDKYITIHCDNKIDSKNYEYFPQVISLLKPFLDKNGYKIYQIGGPEDPKLANVDSSFLNLSYKQSAFLIKNSKLHIGIDSLPIHMASIYDIPIVALYSHIYPSNAYPYWSTKEKIRIIEADRKDLKPSFSYQENPKTIRSIHPEVIAKNALELLAIEQQIKFKTISIGSNFTSKIVEVVPNFRAKLEDQLYNPLYIRADIHFDDQNIAFWCANYKSRIITNQIIPLDLLSQFASNIDSIYFKIINMDITNEYFEEVKKLKIKFSLITEDKENLGKIKNNYFDFLVEFDNQKERIEKQEKYNSFFMTNKIIISDSKLYPSEAHLDLQKSIDIHNEVIHHSDKFWKDSEYFYFYEDK